MSKLLFVTGEGIGNIIQTLPTIKTIQSHGFDVDFLLTNSVFPFPKSIIRSCVYGMEDLSEEMVGRYNGKLMTIWGYFHAKDNTLLNKLRLMNVVVKRQDMRLDMSEVRVYLRIAEDLGISKDNFIYDVRDMLDIPKMNRSFDVALCNGFNYKNPEDKWKAKSYVGYEQLAYYLKGLGLSVCSLGAYHEHIRGTENMTGFSLEKTMGILKNCRVVVSNDSGLYHCAAAMKIPTIVIFTFTSHVKNYDKFFHESVHVMRNGDPCSVDCHQHRKWKTCDDWKCRHIPVEDVFRKVEELL